MYKTGNVIEVKVRKVLKTHVMVKPIDSTNWIGILHISQISDYLVTNLQNLFTVNQNLFLYIVSVDENKQFINFSYKKIRPRFLKNPYEFVLKETPGKSKALVANTLKVVAND